MPVDFDFDGRVAVVTGASGALGSAVVDAFRDAGATVCAVDIREPSHEDAQLDPDDGTHFYPADLTDEDEVADLFDAVAADHGRVDYLANVAGTWRGGSDVADYDAEEFDFLMDVNLKSAFLATKHAVPHLRETEGAVVSVSARSSLSGGEGDGPYRISKAGIRILTETVAEEELGTVRANCVLPSVIDTPMNREMMEPSEDWVDPADIAETFLVLCSEATSVTSGAAVPVYGEA